MSAWILKTYCSTEEHTWTALGCRPNSTCKASAKHLQAAKTSALASPYSLSNRTDHVRVTTMKRLNQGHLYPKLSRFPCTVYNKCVLLWACCGPLTDTIPQQAAYFTAYFIKTKKTVNTCSERRWLWIPTLIEQDTSLYVQCAYLLRLE